MKKISKGLILMIIGVVLTMGVIAQPPGRPPSTKGSAGNQSPNDPSGAPIEPGTGIFLLLALGYGLQKVRENKLVKE